MSKVLFIAPIANDARIRKRMRLIAKKGVEGTLLAFERGVGGDLPYISLGKLEHGNYAKRLLPFVKALGIIRKHAKDASVLYCFNYDMMLLAYLVSLSLPRPIKLVYEVADVREVVLGDKPISKLLRLVDTFLLKRAHHVVFTSQAYYHHYCQDLLGIRQLPYSVIENKLEKSQMEAVANSNQSNAPEPSAKFKVGYFGLIRDPKSWAVMEKLAAKGIQVYVRGRANPPLTDADLKSSPNLTFGGSYVAPDDLPGIYSQVDLVWVVYKWESEASDLKWARANRFYESCCLGKPMIYQIGTQDGRVAAQHNLGLGVDLDKLDEIVEKIANTTAEEIKRWQENVKVLPESIYFYSDEHQKLADVLKAI